MEGCFTFGLDIMMGLLCKCLNCGSFRSFAQLHQRERVSSFMLVRVGSKVKNEGTISMVNDEEGRKEQCCRVL